MLDLDVERQTKRKPEKKRLFVFFHLHVSARVLRPSKDLW